MAFSRLPPTPLPTPSQVMSRSPFPFFAVLFKMPVGLSAAPYLFFPPGGGVSFTPGNLAATLALCMSASSPPPPANPKTKHNKHLSSRPDSGYSTLNPSPLCPKPICLEFCGSEKDSTPTPRSLTVTLLSHRGLLSAPLPSPANQAHGCSSPPLYSVLLSPLFSLSSFRPHHPCLHNSLSRLISFPPAT